MPLLHALPFITYLLAGLLLTRYFVLDSVTNQHRTSVNLMLLIACSSHGYILFDLWQHDGVFFGLTVSMSFVAWVVATLLFLTSFSKPIHSLGILVYPLSAIAVIIAFLFPGTPGQASFYVDCSSCFSIYWRLRSSCNCCWPVSFIKHPRASLT